jgi:hypothetical protein
MADTVFVADPVRLAAEAEANAELDAQIARLQIQLLEKEQQLRAINDELMSTRQEVVRNLAKLQSQASRAEAASGLSEAEIALTRLERRDGGPELADFVDAPRTTAVLSTWPPRHGRLFNPLRRDWEHLTIAHRGQARRSSRSPSHSGRSAAAISGRDQA